MRWFSEHFSSVCLKPPFELPLDKCPNDDKFFEYFRSLVFAHPTKTNRPKFFKAGEIQYSPWVIANSKITAIMSKRDDYVGVRVYTNLSEEMFNILISFNRLKKYVQSRYTLIEMIINKITSMINEQEIEWKKRKVNRTLPTLDILHDIQSIFDERHVDYTVENFISYLSCRLSNTENVKSVTQFREALLNLIPRLCDAVDNMEYNKCYDVIAIANVSPLSTHEWYQYQIEKIFTYLDDENGERNIGWGLQQANNFAQEFAKKWVTIDTETMSFDEIKLLVRTACYLEWKEQIAD